MSSAPLCQCRGSQEAMRFHNSISLHALQFLPKLQLQLLSWGVRASSCLNYAKGEGVTNDVIASLLRKLLYQPIKLSENVKVIIYRSFVFAP
jgi:hypothetical protein